MNIEQEQNDKQGIFADEISNLLNHFGEACNQQNINTAIAIVPDPTNPQNIKTFFRGNIYEVARALAFTLRTIKDTIAKELDTN